MDLCFAVGLPLQNNSASANSNFSVTQATDSIDLLWTSPFTGVNHSGVNLNNKHASMFDLDSVCLYDEHHPTDVHPLRREANETISVTPCHRRRTWNARL